MVRLETAAIVTTRANRALSTIHERMPSQLSRLKLYSICGSITQMSTLKQLCGADCARPRKALLDAYEVSTLQSIVPPMTIRSWYRRFSPPAEAVPPPAPSVPRQRAKRVKKDDGQGALF